MLSPTAERIIPEHSDSEDGRLMYLRHLFAYEEVARRLPPETLVLDIGCGEGYGTDLLARRVQRAEGIDVDAAAIDHAEQTYGRDTCHYQVYDGVCIPFPAGAFDAAVTCQVIEHVVDDTGFISDASRVLRSGGLFIVTTPNRLLRLAPGQRPWNRYHVREYAPDELHELLAPHFAAVELLGVTGDANAQAHELARLAWVRRTVTRDVLGLRRLLPEGMKRRILGVLRGTRGQPGSVVAGWTTERYRLTNDASESLDLFAVCSR